jgi:hypothetical protein
VTSVLFAFVGSSASSSSIVAVSDQQGNFKIRSCMVSFSPCDVVIAFREMLQYC